MTTDQVQGHEYVLRHLRLAWPADSTRIRIRPNPTTAVVEIAGELDAGTAERLRRELASAFAQRSRVVVDARTVSFFDCANVSALVAARGAIEDAGGAFCIVTNAYVERLLQLIGSDLPLADSVLGAQILVDRAADSASQGSGRRPVDTAG